MARNMICHFLPFGSKHLDGSPLPPWSPYNIYIHIWEGTSGRGERGAREDRAVHPGQHGASVQCTYMHGIPT